MSARLSPDFCGIAERQSMRAGCRRLRQRHRGQLLLIAGDDALDRPAIQTHVAQNLIERVEYDGCRKGAKLQRHGLPTVQRQVRRVWHDLDHVIERHHVLGEPARNRFEGIRRSDTGTDLP